MTDLETVLERVSPETREQFLKSRLRLKQFSENDELLAIAIHLESFACVIKDLTSGAIPRDEKDIQSARDKIVLLTQSVDDLNLNFDEVRRHVRVVVDGSMWAYWLIIGATFVIGVLICLLVVFLTHVL